MSVRLTRQLLWERWLKRAGVFERAWVFMTSTGSFVVLLYQLASH